MLHLNPFHFFAPQPAENGDARGCLFAPRQTEVLKGHVDIDLLHHVGQDAKGNPLAQ
jgi:hypothetical protein